MKRMSRAIGLAAMLALSLAAASLAIDKGRVLNVQVKQSEVRRSASPLGQVIGTAAFGDQMVVLEEKGMWVKVTRTGLTGWMHMSALTKDKLKMQAGQTDAQVKASSGEQSLAGKGFTREMESAFRDKNKNANFEWVDKNCRATRSPRSKAELRQGRRPEVRGRRRSMNRNLSFVFVALMLAVLVLCGCEAMKVVGRGLPYAGFIPGGQGSLVQKTAEASFKAHEKFTPENEYYLGRAVTATVLAKYQPLDDPKANEYINLLGQTLAMASAKPETFGGYHFLILDTDEINAIAAPGGFILVSRGLLACCQDEESLAAVLAHEVAHVELDHGVKKAISAARWKTAGMTAALETGKSVGGAPVSAAMDAFEGSITDITDKIINSGYARKQEFQADKAAVEILNRVGYSPAGLKTMLQEMDNHVKPQDQHGFGKTHPGAQGPYRRDRAAPAATVAASPAAGARDPCQTICRGDGRDPSRRSLRLRQC